LESGLFIEKPYFCKNIHTKIMITNKTFTMLKPDSVEKGNIGGIIEKITASGFRIVAMKLTQLTKADAEVFYAIHSERPFYGELVTYMTRGPIVAAILEKENAVEDFRTLIGSTNPAEAAEGTIRNMFADSISENAVHGSDSDENAAIESAFHFSGRDMF
jgi:nucleoside-diphosphate kinase